MMLMEHFSLEEMTRTDTGLENDPSVWAGANLVKLCELVMEPIRALLSTGIVPSSGYRSPDVTKRVGGAMNSAHLDGRACDFHPMDMDPETAFHAIRVSEIPYDKLILERRSHTEVRWIHVQIAKSGHTARRKAYRAEVGDNGPIYTEVMP